MLQPQTDFFVIDLNAFETECRADIPLLDAMELAFTGYENLSLWMEAPLAPNINNKGTAFGGSIASICLFGGWAVATLGFIDAGVRNTEIVVYTSEMTFERPARGLLRVRAFIEPKAFRACLARLQSGDARRIRFDVHVELFHDEERCATMKGVYVVWLK